MVLTPVKYILDCFRTRVYHLVAAACVIITGLPPKAAIADTPISPSRASSSEAPIPAESTAKTSTSPQRSDNSIDRIIAQRQQAAGIVAAPLCEDVVFLRRVSVDLLGRIPTISEITYFEKAEGPDKRAELVDKLLDSQEFEYKWGAWLAQLTGARPQNFSLIRGAASHLRVTPEQLVGSWANWFAARLHEDASCQEMLAQVLLATSRDGMTSPEYQAWADALKKNDSSKVLNQYSRKETNDLFLRLYARPEVREAMPGFIGEAFLGQSLECAQCHDHPFSEWKQRDYESILQAFSAVKYDVPPRLTVPERRRILFQGGLGAVGISLTTLLLGALLLKWQWIRLAAVLGWLFLLQLSLGIYLVHAFGHLLTGQSPENYRTWGQKFATSVQFILPINSSEIMLMTLMVLSLLAATGALWFALLRPRTCWRSMVKRSGWTVAGLLLSIVCGDALFAVRNHDQRRPGLNLFVWLRREYLEPATYRERSDWEIIESKDPGAESESELITSLSNSEHATEELSWKSRQDFMDWLTAGDQPPLAVNLVNRTWKEFFGEGIVDPVGRMDQPEFRFSPELLEQLVREFCQNNWSLKELIRLIVLSDTYQRSSNGAFSGTVESIESMSNGEHILTAAGSVYSHFPPRPLPAEVLVHTLRRELDWTMASPLGEETLPSVYFVSGFPSTPGNEMARLLRLFGGNDRNSVSTSAIMFFLADRGLDKQIQQLASSYQLTATDELAIRNTCSELFLKLLSRKPQEEELKALVHYVRSHQHETADAISDVIWAILNRPAFSTLE